jgi:hypothetical protein
MEPGGFELCYKIQGIRRKTMRAFGIACLTAVVISVGAAAILDNFVQQSAAVAFAEPTARV